MRTNRCDHDSRHTGMDHGGTGRHRVGCAPRGCADYQTVTLHAGDVLAVQEQVDVGQVGRGPSVHYNFVEDQEIRGCLLGLLVFVVVNFLLALAHHYAAQPAAQREGRVAFEDVVYLFLEGIERQGFTLDCHFLLWCYFIGSEPEEQFFIYFIKARYRNVQMVL